MSLAQWRWCAAFLRECSTARSEQGTIDLLQLGHYSQELLRSLLAEEALDFDYRRSGKLVVYRDPRAFAGARRQMAFQAALGSRQEALDPRACIAKEPALAEVERHLAGGIWTASEDAGDCHRFSRELARVAATRYRVDFRYGTEVSGFRTAGARVECVTTRDGDVVEADAFVVALGTAGRDLLKPLGIDLPIYPLKGYSLTVPIDDAHCAPTVSITDLHHKIVYARLGARLRVAGMVDMTGANPARDAYRLDLLTRQARKTFPQGGDYANAQSWSGARPATPDSKPILGASSYANLWLNTGQGSLGFTFACASARLVADTIAQRPPALSLAPYGLTRRRADSGARARAAYP
jgi:D-amino-acid dehydrogenase